MAFIGDMMDWWAEDESPELDRALWALYGPILRVGCMFPSWRRDKRVVSAILMIWYMFVICFHGWVLIVSIILELKDVMLSSLILHYLVFLIFVACSIVIFQFKRRYVVSVHEAFLGDFCTYCSGRIYDDEEVKEIKERIDGETIKLATLPTGLVGIITVAILLVPYIKNLNQEEIYRPSGISTTLPIPAWYPYDTHSGLLHAVTVGLQLALAGSLAVVAIGDLLMMYRVCQKIRFEYKVLSYSVATLLDRALQVYVQQHPNRSKHQTEQQDSVYQHYVGLCLKDSVLHHLKISQTVREIEQVSSSQVALAYIAGVAAIGLSLINIISLWGQEDYENVVVFGGLMVCETINMFMISAIGEAITTESNNLRDQLYFMDWHKLNLKNRKTYQIFQVGVTEPVALKTGLLMDVCLDTFTTIINSAYSFFNIMNA